MRKKLLAILICSAVPIGAMMFLVKIPITVASYRTEAPPEITRLIIGNMTLTIQNFSTSFTMDNKTYNINLEYAYVHIFTVEKETMIDVYATNLEITGTYNVAFDEVDLHLVLITTKTETYFEVTASIYQTPWELFVKWTQNR